MLLLKQIQFFINLIIVELSPLFFMPVLFVDISAYLVFKFCNEWFRLKFIRVGKHHLFVPGPKKHCMWLCNHRSWGDFFIDHKLTGFQGAYLSRWMVLVAVPLCGIMGYLLDWVWFFHRPSKKEKLDMKWFYSFLDGKFEKTPWRGLIVYPEGTRGCQSHSLPLRWGCIVYAYKRKIPVQIIITTDKEKVFNEKTFQNEYNVMARVSYSQLIDPIEYDTLQLFNEQVQKVWNDQWQLVYHSGQSGTPWEPPCIAKPGMRTGKIQFFFILFIIVLYTSLLWLTWLIINKYFL